MMRKEYLEIGKASPHAGIALRLKTPGEKWAGRNRQHRSPRHFRQSSRAGFRACKSCFIAFPDIQVQWHSDEAALAYRCGGSSGFVRYSCKGRRTAFPFRATDEIRRDTCNGLDYTDLRVAGQKFEGGFGFLISFINHVAAFFAPSSRLPANEGSVDGSCDPAPPSFDRFQ
jgi:hypothetical protein